ncbi:MAG: GGDEF domain-containing protein, partial [Chloroflexi bacterium]|nr:GGDEF domain-containing protein [Chloroflexota bacterium]
MMEATASTAAQVSERVLAQLVEHLKADSGFVRHNDHYRRESVLVAEWPRRQNIPDPDPLAVVHFSSADPVLSLCDHGNTPIVIPPNQLEGAYHHWVATRSHAAAPSVAVAPLVAGGVTNGALGVVRFGGKKWKPDQVETLEAIASLFAQLQARIAAEEKLRYLAEHDDLTGLHNRRALVDHLSDRLKAGRNGPVAVLFMDLDRLKSINDYLGHTAGDCYIQVFAEQLRAQIGSQGMIARIGGDEFVVVPDRAMSIDEAQLLADELRGALRDRVAIGG